MLLSIAHAAMCCSTSSNMVQQSWCLLLQSSTSPHSTQRWSQLSSQSPQSLHSVLCCEVSPPPVSHPLCKRPSVYRGVCPDLRPPTPLPIRALLVAPSSSSPLCSRSHPSLANRSASSLKGKYSGPTSTLG